MQRWVPSVNTRCVKIERKVKNRMWLSSFLPTRQNIAIKSFFWCFVSYCKKNSLKCFAFVAKAESLLVIHIQFGDFQVFEQREAVNAMVNRAQCWVPPLNMQYGKFSGKQSVLTFISSTIPANREKVKLLSIALYVMNILFSRTRCDFTSTLHKIDIVCVWL